MLTALVIIGVAFTAFTFAATIVLAALGALVRLRGAR